MKKYFISLSALVLGSQLIAADKPITQAPSSPKQQEFNQKPSQPTPPLDLEQEVTNNEESDITSGQGNKLPLPKLTTKKSSIKSYDAIIDMLKTKESFKVQKNQDDEKDRQMKAKAEEVEKKNKFKAELGEMLLPIPLRSIIIGNKIQVYAEYREKKLKDSATLSSQGQQQVPVQQFQNNQLPPLSGTQSNMSSDQLEQLETEYAKKTIELNTGDSFGDWEVKTLKISYVEYVSKKDKSKTIKKYY